MQTLSN